MSTTLKVISLFMALSAATANAQQVLDGYVHEALAANNGVKQQQFQLDKSLQALNEAKTLFLPSVSMLGSYNLAAGGRTIDLPIGDLLNPAYSTLNQLTNDHKFPTLQNQSVLLNPSNFYDVKFRTSMPLIDAEVYYNHKIRQQAITLQQASVNVYKRALVKDVKAAYYQYYQALQATDIYRTTLTLIDRNIAMNESLLRNGVRNSTALTRSQAEKQNNEALLTQAENNAKNARAYFNFLLNKPLDADIAIDTAWFAADRLEAAGVADADVSHREELLEINTKKEIYALNTQLQRASFVPRLNTFIDLGSQGFDWKVDDKSRYYFFGINLQWDLFAWGQHNYRTRQAALDVSSAAVEYDEAEKSFRLQLTNALNNFNTAVSSYHSAQTQQQLAEKYYSDQLKAYREGQLLYIELLDAQNQLTTARLQLSLAFAGVQIARAEAERDMATYPLN